MKIANVAAGMAVILALGGQAYAAATENMTVQASVSAVLSVALAGTPGNFTGVGAGSTVTADTPIVATNDGSGVTETYQVSIVDPANWTSAGTPASEVFSMYGQFNSVVPSLFLAANHLLTTTPVLSTALQFAGDQDALNVAHLATRDLWLRFDAPTLTAFTAVQSITVVVTATP